MLRMISSKLLLLIVGAVAVNGSLVDDLGDCPPGLPRTQYVKSYNDKCLYLITGKFSWNHANSNCRNHGGRLVQIQDRDKQDFIYNTLKSMHWGDWGVWIGATDHDSEGTWKWTDDMEKSIHAFLRQRGVDTQTIDLMEEKKIDSYVIQIMSDESLMEYLPHEGDRIALKGFCKASFNDRGNTSSDRKNALFASLRKKLKMKESGYTSDENPRKKSHLSGNKNAKKTTRKIELGWLHFDVTTQIFKQVRKKNGGGTRKLDIEKGSDRYDLEEKAKSLFFCNGMSKMGPIENFSTEIRDFSEDLITSSETVGEMYQRTGINVLRFFLATTLKSSSKDVDSNSFVGASSTASKSFSASAQASPLDVPFASGSAPSHDSLPRLNTIHRTRAKHITSLSTEASKVPGTSSLQIDIDHNSVLGASSTAPKSFLDSAQASPLYFSFSSGSASSTDSLPSLNTMDHTEEKHIDSLSTEASKVPNASSLQIDIDHFPTFSGTGSMTMSGHPSTSSIDTEYTDATLKLDARDTNDASEKMVSLNDTETEIFFRALEDSISEQKDVTLPSSPSTNFSTPLEMTIHRGPMAFNELIGYFKDPSIAQRQLIITRILPNGDSELAEDTGGVWRDLLTEFWCEFYERCTMGRSAKVPCLRHDFGGMEWRSVGRILVHGYRFVNYWPVQLARCFVMHCIDSNYEVLPSELLQDFYHYVSIPDKEVFQKAVDDFDSVDTDDLLEALDMHDGKCSPTKENIKSILMEMAHKEIIQTPMFVCSCWKEGFATMNITASKLDVMYDALQLSNKKVVQILSFPEEMDAQSTGVATHLKRYVKNLDIQKLGLFMRYCTGSDLLTIDKISVEFTVLSGLQRRPVAHTCACMLQLSKTYESFMDFRTEFDNVLSGNVWVMDIV